MLLAFAGIVKSAQMPFSPWLTGAMVAPTPVSALLHSSTMVKAGVYLLLKVSPILNGTPAGICITCIGAITFLFASFIAVSQSDAKRVLAYSTIATLALDRHVRGSRNLRGRLVRHSCSSSFTPWQSPCSSFAWA